MTDRVDPLPCPFCGHLPLIDEWKDFIKCTNKSCGVRPAIKKFGAFLIDERRPYGAPKRIDTMDWKIAMWNTRS